MFQYFSENSFFFHLCSLDSIIVIVSADKAIMYFKLVLKNAPSPVQILLLFSYNNDARPFHLPLIFLLQIGQERKKLPAMNMNSEFGYVICRTETVNSSECIFFFFDRDSFWKQNLMKSSVLFIKYSKKHFLDTTCQSVLCYCSFFFPFFFFLLIGICLEGCKQIPGWYLNKDIVDPFSFNPWISLLIQINKSQSLY